MTHHQAPVSLHSRLALRIILPCFIASVIAYLDRVNVAYAALTMNSDLGFTPEVFGMGAGIFFLGYVLFEVPGALIAERFSPRLWLARIMITWGIISAFMALVQTAWQFYLVRFLLGVAEASFYPVIYASVIPRWFTPAERPKAIALMLTSLQVSAMIGSPLAGALLGFEILGFRGWQALFLIEAVPALIFGVVILYAIADWPAEVDWLSEDEKRSLTESYERETAAKRALRQYTVGQALRDPAVLRLCCIYFLWITGFWGFNYWMPTSLKEASGWSTLAIGLLIVLPMGLSLAAMVYTGHSSSARHERRWHAAVPLMIGALGMAGGVWFREPLPNFFFVCVTAVGVYAAFGVWWSIPTSFFSGAAAAGAVGLINSFGNVGGYVGPYLMGFLRGQTGSFEIASLVLAASLAAAGGLMLTLPRRAPADDHAPPSGPGA